MVYLSKWWQSFWYGFWEHLSVLAHYILCGDNPCSDRSTGRRAVDPNSKLGEVNS